MTERKPNLPYLHSDQHTAAVTGCFGDPVVQTPNLDALGTDQLHGYAERPIGDHGSNFPGTGGAASGQRNSVERSGPGQSSYGLHDEDVTACAVDFLDRLGAERRAGKEIELFSLSVGFILPHSPYVARRKGYEYYREKVTMPKHRVPYTDDLHPFEKWWREWSGTESVADDDIRRARIAY